MPAYSADQRVLGKSLVSILGDMLALTIPRLMVGGIVKNKDSFGVAVADLRYTGNFRSVWDQPDKLIGFVYGWGPEKDKYISNAARKIRAAARTSQDTLWIVQNCPELFEDVDSPDGDFPWGGATHVRGELVGVSALTQEEDDWVARMIGGFLATEKAKIIARYDEHN